MLGGGSFIGETRESCMEFEGVGFGAWDKWALECILQEAHERMSSGRRLLEDGGDEGQALESMAIGILSRRETGCILYHIHTKIPVPVHTHIMKCEKRSTPTSATLL